MRTGDVWGFDLEHCKFHFSKVISAEIEIENFEQQIFEMEIYTENTENT